MSVARCPFCRAFKNADPAAPCPHCGQSGGAPPGEALPAAPVRPPAEPRRRPRPESRTWFTYPVVVLLITLPLAALSGLLNGYFAWSHESEVRADEEAAGDDPQRAALFGRSWRLTKNGGIHRGVGFDGTFVATNSVWTFRRDELLAGELYENGEYGGAGLNLPDRWQYRLAPDRLRITETGHQSPTTYEFRVVEVTSEALVLEATAPEFYKGRKLTFAGRPRVPLPYRGWPPLWLFVLVQATAALVAHFVARSRATRGGRFFAYLLIHTAVAILVSLLGLLYEQTGFFAWLGQRLLVMASGMIGLAWGVVGGVLHMNTARRV